MSAEIQKCKARGIGEAKAVEFEKGFYVGARGKSGVKDASGDLRLGLKSVNE